MDENGVIVDEMLCIDRVTVKYGPCAVLNDVSIKLRRGRVIALLGPNGAGKTTLLKAMNGAVAPASGEVRLGAKRLGDHSRREIARQIAVVAQENETKFPVTVMEFVLSGRFASGSALGWEGEADRAIAEEALADCDLTGYGSRVMNELSGGERQRIVLARALATGARILLLDEPTANLDIAHQALMFRLVVERCRNNGYSAVVITHDLNLASEFGDEMVLVKDGKIFAAGPAYDVLTEANLQSVFGVKTLLDANPASGNLRITAVF